MQAGAGLNGFHSAGGARDFRADFVWLPADHKPLHQIKIAWGGGGVPGFGYEIDFAVRMVPPYELKEFPCCFERLGEGGEMRG